MRLQEILILNIFLSLAFLDTNSIKLQKSVLKPTVERVFLRKKRFLLFPPGTFFKFTCTLTTNLIAQYPRGLGFVTEIAFYYPVPGLVEELYPKRLRPPSTMKPKSKAPTKPILVYIPGTDWRFKAKPVVKQKPFYKKLPRINENTILWTDTAYNNSAKWSVYGQKHANMWTPAKKYKEYEGPWSSTFNENWLKWTTIAPTTASWSNYGAKWKDIANKWQFKREIHEEAMEQEEGREPYIDPTIADYEYHDYADMEHLRHWSHYHAHRDRRHLFDHFSGFSNLFGFDVKHCILRAICESKSLLLPPGCSMLHDIIRLIFTMPTTAGLEDDYSRTMRENATVCQEKLRNKCNISLVAWLLGGKWAARGN